MRDLKIITTVHISNKTANVCYNHKQGYLMLQFDCGSNYPCNQCCCNDDNDYCTFDQFACGYNSNKSTYFEKIRDCKYNYAENAENLDLTQFRYKTDIPTLLIGEWYVINNKTVKITAQINDLVNKKGKVRHYLSKIKYDQELSHGVILPNQGEISIDVIQNTNTITVNYSADKQLEIVSKKLKEAEKMIDSLHDNIMSLEEHFNNKLNEVANQLDSRISTESYNRKQSLMRHDAIQDRKEEKLKNDYERNEEYQRSLRIGGWRDGKW